MNETEAKQIQGDLMESSPARKTPPSIRKLGPHAGFMVFDSYIHRCRSITEAAIELRLGESTFRRALAFFDIPKRDKGRFSKDEVIIRKFTS